MVTEMQHLRDYWYDNRVPIMAGLTLLISSAVKTLPAPGTPFSFYTFFYDWSHQFLNITNTRLTTQPIVTPPAASGEMLPTPKV